MGYTHYWNFKKSPVEIENGTQMFKDAANLFKKGLSLIPPVITKKELKWNSELGDYDEKEVEYKFALAGPMGTGEPIITDTAVEFNGKDDDSYESCILSVHDDDSFNFCKTARQPYDVAVCLALLCFKKVFGENFKYSSDGNGTEDGWVLAKKIFKKIAK